MCMYTKIKHVFSEVMCVQRHIYVHIYVYITAEADVKSVTG